MTETPNATCGDCGGTVELTVYWKDVIGFEMKAECADCGKQAYNDPAEWSA